MNNIDKSKKFLDKKNNKERNSILLNGALISVGLVAVLDMLIPHWLFKWHRLVPNHTISTVLEVALFIFGLISLGVGIYREIKARR